MEDGFDANAFRHFHALSKELGPTGVSKLVCPADTSKIPARDWNGLAPSNGTCLLRSGEPVIAGHGEIKDGRFHLWGLVADLDGSQVIKSELTGDAAAAATIGIDLAERLLSRGADRILEKLQTLETENGQS